MLSLRTKTVIIAGKPVKVYSFDGKMWFSKGRDMTEFHQRRQHAKTTIHAALARWFNGRFNDENRKRRVRIKPRRPLGTRH